MAEKLNLYGQINLFSSIKISRSVTIESISSLETNTQDVIIKLNSKYSVFKIITTDLRVVLSTPGVDASFFDLVGILQGKFHNCGNS